MEESHLKDQMSLHNLHTDENFKRNFVYFFRIFFFKEP